MHPPTYCFIQAMNCAQHAFDEPNEKARQFLRHMEDSWIAAAWRRHEQHERPAELISLHPIRNVLRVASG